MGYIAFIDYKNLDNSLFLKSLASATASQDTKITPRIFIHSDSEYTERLIQTGMMREDARSRAIRELNKHLVILFADYGVPAIGLNGYQRELATFDADAGRLTIDRRYLYSLPPQAILVVSNLIHIVGEEKPQVCSIQRYLAELSGLQGISNLYAFSSPEIISDNIFNSMKKELSTKNEKKTDKESPPQELIDTSLNVKIITIEKFSQINNN